MTYIIAEIGSCFKTKADCLESIYHAKASGADAVKFQCFDSWSLYGRHIPTFKNHSISPFWIYDLSKRAKELEIDFGVTFFDHEQLLRHEKHLDFIKIASSDMEHKSLLKVASRIHAATEKPLFISTGGHTLNEVRAVATWVRATFLYCDSEYPSTDIDLKAVRDLELLVKDRVGISDHTKGVGELTLAHDIFNFPVVEKHVNFLGIQGHPDSPHSVGPAEFAFLCEDLKNRMPSNLLKAGEHEMRLRHNRRVVAIKDIKAGEDFDLQNIGFFRGTSDCENYMNAIEQVYGKTAQREYVRGETITL